MTARLLIIDDEDLFREDLAVLLRRQGYDCATASNGEKGLANVRDFEPDIVLCDVVMPGKGGVDILDEITSTSPQTFVIMITAYGSLETAVDAFRKGAADYIIKPFLLEDVLQKIERLMGYKRLSRQVELLRREVSRDVESLPIVGTSDAIKKVFDLIRKVAPTRSTVLLTGASGTGKELVARTIHHISSAHDLPFVAINCPGIPEQLLESELFGHVRGAFTGAIADREGFFDLAGEGTVFLDEISEMPLSLQVKLLRVLEEKEFVHLGGRSVLPFRARVIVSTNRNLRDLVKQGAFREDLFFRIAVFEIPLPALRERRSDIPLLIEYFVRKFNEELKRDCLGVSNEAVRELLCYDWPGNVRELRNVIERAMILVSGDYITPADLPLQITKRFHFPRYCDDLRSAMRSYEREHIRAVLDSVDGNREEAARRLEINPSTLYRKMADLGLGREEPSH